MATDKAAPSACSPSKIAGADQAAVPNADNPDRGFRVGQVDVPQDCEGEENCTFDFACERSLVGYEGLRFPRLSSD